MADWARMAQLLEEKKKHEEAALKTKAQQKVVLDNSRNGVEQRVKSSTQEPISACVGNKFGFFGFRTSVSAARKDMEAVVDQHRSRYERWTGACNNVAKKQKQELSEQIRKEDRITSDTTANGNQWSNNDNNIDINESTAVSNNDECKMRR